MAETKKKTDEPVVETESVANDDVAAILLDEATRGYREWEYEDVKYITRFPTAEEDAKAGWEYSKAFNEALKAGLPTRKEMNKILIERGVISPDEDAEVESKREKMAGLEEYLAKREPGDDTPETRRVIAELMLLRSEVMESINEVQTYMQNTVEFKADEARSAYLISRVTLKGDAKGGRVWDKPEDFLTDTNTRLVNTATYQYTTFSLGIYENYFETLPEVQFLKAGKTDEVGE